MPAPRPTEKKKQYLYRCMADPHMKSKYPRQDQRYAVCLVLWKEEK